MSAVQLSEMDDLMYPTRPKRSHGDSTLGLIVDAAFGTLSFVVCLVALPFLLPIALMFRSDLTPGRMKRKELDSVKESHRTATAIDAPQQFSFQKDDRLCEMYQRFPWPPVSVSFVHVWYVKTLKTKVTLAALASYIDQTTVGREQLRAAELA